jgi:cephalosporin hydroxylase
MGKMIKKIISLCFVFFFSHSILCAQGSDDALKQRVCNVMPYLEGWCSKEKALSFIDLVLEVKPKVCVEIGVYGGSSLFPVASALKYLGEGVVIGIDPWDRVESIRYFDPERDRAMMEWWGKINLTYIYYSYLNMLRRYELEEQVTTLKMSSEKAAAEVGEIDILYLDGNHTEYMTTLDVQLYLPKVRSGGYIWLNDTLWECIQPAIDLLLDECDAIKLIDNGNCILFRKR